MRKIDVAAGSILTLAVLGLFVIMGLAIFQSEKRGGACEAWVRSVGGLRRLHARDIECCAVMRDGSVRCQTTEAGR